MPSNQAQALMDCLCGCGGNCVIPCCENFNLEDTQLVNEGYGPGTLGCDDLGGGCIGTLCDNGMRMAVGTPSTYEELFAPDTICSVWSSEGAFSVAGLIGTIEFEVVVACINNGNQYRAFVRYTVNPGNNPSMPVDTWIETEAGWTCPDCSVPGTAPGGSYAYLYVDVFMDCTYCRTADYDYGPPEGCVPDTLYSVRFYFSGFGYCQ